MYGLKAISTYNGWAMAIAGALIVFSGLVVLSTAISQLHKILLFFEKRYSDFRAIDKIQEKDEPEEQPDSDLPRVFPTEIDEVAGFYQPFIDEIGETFYLSDLYKIAKEKNFPHPHITLTAFRDAKIIIPYGDGVFSWNPPLVNSVSENE